MCARFDASGGTKETERHIYAQPKGTGTRNNENNAFSQGAYVVYPRKNGYAVGAYIGAHYYCRRGVYIYAARCKSYIKSPYRKLCFRGI